MNKYPLSATFIDEITYDIPSNNFSHEQWVKELDYMKDIGIDTVVFIRGFFMGKCLYPSAIFPHEKDEDDDLPKLIFEAAQERDMKVFMGLYIKNVDWDRGQYEHEIDMNRIFIKEVYERYGKYKSFYGWYIPHEVGNNIYGITHIFKEVSKMCKELDPTKKILISPFFHTYVLGVPIEESLSPEQMYEEWDGIFKESGELIDYCAFQDTSAPIKLIPDYFMWVKKACDKYNVELWANIELLTRNTKNFYPIDFDLLRFKLSAAAPYVSKFMTFEFSHFMSPQSMFPSAKNLYYLYKDYYSKK